MTEQEFYEAYEPLKNILHSGATLPEQVFLRNYKCHLFCEYHAILRGTFLLFLSSLMKSLNESFSTWITLDPDPVSYFFRHFGHFGCAVINPNDTEEAYMKFLNYSADGKPAEALMHRPIRVAIVASDSQWCIYADAKVEMALIAMSNHKIAQLAANNTGGVCFLPIGDALEMPLGYAFSDRCLTNERKLTLRKNYGERVINS